MNNKLKNITIATAIAIATTGFGQIDRSSAAEAKVGTITQPLNVARKSLWLTPNVPICWETAGSSTEKNWVRQAIASTWETASILNFTYMRLFGRRLAVARG